MLPSARRREALTAAIETGIDDFCSEILDYDVRAARAYATLQEHRTAKGRPLSVEDSMIAAICLSANARLATRNTVDFGGLGIELGDPWKGT